MRSSSAAMIVCGESDAAAGSAAAGAKRVPGPLLALPHRRPRRLPMRCRAPEPAARSPAAPGGPAGTCVVPDAGAARASRCLLARLAGVVDIAQVVDAGEDVLATPHLTSPRRSLSWSGMTLKLVLHCGQVVANAMPVSYRPCPRRPRALLVPGPAFSRGCRRDTPIRRAPARGPPAGSRHRTARPLRSGARARLKARACRRAPPATSALAPAA